MGSEMCIRDRGKTGVGGGYGAAGYGRRQPSRQVQVIGDESDAMSERRWARRAPVEGANAADKYDDLDDEVDEDSIHSPFKAHDERASNRGAAGRGRVLATALQRENGRDGSDRKSGGAGSVGRTRASLQADESDRDRARHPDDLGGRDVPRKGRASGRDESRRTSRNSNGCETGFVAGLRWRISDGPHVGQNDEDDSASRHSSVGKDARHFEQLVPNPSWHANNDGRGPHDDEDELTRGLHAELVQLRQLRASETGSSKATSRAGAPLSGNMRDGCAPSHVPPQRQRQQPPANRNGCIEHGRAHSEQFDTAIERMGRHIAHQQEQVERDIRSCEQNVQAVDLAAAGPGLAERRCIDELPRDPESESTISPTTVSSVSTATAGRHRKRKVWKRPPVPLDKVIEAEDAAALLRSLPEVP